MVFSSPIFVFLFLPILVISYIFISRISYYKIKIIWLVTASFVFYGFWKAEYLFLLMGTIIFNYSFGYYLSRSIKHEKEQTRKQVLHLGIAANIGAIALFKYLDFFIEVTNSVAVMNIKPVGLILPLGISFFTFQQIAYLVDSYRGETHEYNLLNYTLFVSFFPQLIAGPIVHHREIMAQLKKSKITTINHNNFKQGIIIFIIGLFKKVVIADTLSLIANPVFESAVPVSFVDAWLGSLSYTMQIYFDFSAYSEMAIGIALLFNIRLPINFNSPYKSLSVQEFWQRWHITLSRWMKEYIYIPLGGNKVRNSQMFLNLMITFLLGGVWHGAGWTFVIWGLLHGTALITHRGWKTLNLKIPRFLSWVFTFLFVHLSWVLFRATDFQHAMDMYTYMFSIRSFENTELIYPQLIQHIHPMYWTVFSSINEGTLAWVWSYLAISMVVALTMPNILEICKYSITEQNNFIFNKKLLPSIWFGILAGTAIVYMLTSGESVEFLYFDF